MKKIKCPYFKVSNKLERPERCTPGKKNPSELFTCGDHCDILARTKRRIKHARNPFVEIPRKGVRRSPEEGNYNPTDMTKYGYKGANYGE